MLIFNSMPCLPSDKLGQQRACLIFIFLAPGKILETDEGGRGGGGGGKNTCKIASSALGKSWPEVFSSNFCKSWLIWVVYEALNTKFRDLDIYEISKLFGYDSRLNKFKV